MSKRDLYQEVTDRIIDALEGGTMPWNRPWTSNGATGLPYNVASGKPYNGINVVLLWSAAMANDFTTDGWMTFKQAKQAGGCVKKGSKSTMIVFFQIRKIKDKNQLDENGDPKEKKVPLLRYYNVFNLDQIEGIEHKRPNTEDIVGYDNIEAFIDRVGADIRHKGDRAFYSPTLDYIQLPQRKQFESLEAYYATSLHEHTHWTGHNSRLDRGLEKSDGFGSESYAREELVAELGSAFLCAALGVEGQMQHPEYIASWLKTLKEDKYEIFRASRKARDAANFILEAGGEMERQQAA